MQNSATTRSRHVAVEISGPGAERIRPDDRAAPFHSHPVLSHPTRRRVYNHLRVLPGDHFRSIVRALTIGVGSARHHISILVRAGLIYERRSAGRCRYYVVGDEGQRDRNEAFGKHWSYRATRLRVWTVLQRMDSPTAARMAKALGISRQLATYHLSRFEAQGLAVRRDGRYRVVDGSRKPSDFTNERARSS